MSIIRMFPTGDVSTANVNVVNSPVAWDAMSDNDDSTSVSHFGPGTSYTLQDMNDPFIASNQRIRTVRAMVRYRTGNGTTDMHAYIEEAGTGNQLDSGVWTDNYSAGPFDRFGPTFSGRWVSGIEWTPTDINNIRLRVSDNNGGTSKPQVVRGMVEVVVQSKPTVSITSPTGELRTRTPTVSWQGTFPDAPDGYGQRSYQVKVYTVAEYSAGGFNADTTPTTIFNTGVVTNGSVSSVQLPTLGNGSFRIYVKASVDFLGADWWSNWAFANISVSDSPPTPGGISPKSGATVPTDTPILTMGMVPSALNSRVRAEWQLSTDSLFSTNLRLVSQSASDLQYRGTATMTIPNESQLYQTTWWIRGRQIDEYGTPGPYSTPQSFVVSHKPVATNLSPGGGVSIPYAATETLTWRFSDPSPVDTQTGYHVTVRKHSDGTLIYDSGDVISTNSSVVATGFTGQQDVEMEWQVAVRDRDAVWGPFSAITTFFPRNVPVVTITSPTAGGTVNNPAPLFTWTFFAEGGRVQKQFRVVISRPSETVYDSTWITSNAVSFRPPPVLKNSISDYTVTVYVVDSGGMQDSDAKAFVTAWTPPAAPAYTIDTSVYESSGYVKINWTNASKDATWVSWRVYRRLPSDTIWTLLLESTVDQANYEFDDWTAGASVGYQYTVVQVATRFGENVESVYNVTAVTPTSEDYWLIDPTDYSQSVRLRHVRGDEYRDEHEEEEMLIINRGRHTDYGSRWGYKGSLSAQIYDEGVLTARVQRQRLMAARANHRTLLLRNPFGDLWQVTTGEMNISRIAGVGSREYVVITIPYSEVS
jgi:hypothetical protein